MTYRDRLERQLSKREEWAGKAATRSEQASQRSDAISERFAGGQPILVGHHSEGRARRDQERMHNAMSAAVEEAHLAQHHAQAADGIARQLETSIFSDDHDALDALESRISERERQAAVMVARNKAWRTSKGDIPTFAQLAGISLADAQSIATDIAKAYSWEKQPYASWELTNLRATIRRDKERIKDIQSRTVKLEKAEATGGVNVVEITYGGQPTGQVAVTFAEKPDRVTINALKEAGFHWSNPSWYGQTSKLPDGIRG